MARCAHIGQGLPTQRTYRHCPLVRETGVWLAGQTDFEGCVANWCGVPAGLEGEQSRHMPEADGLVNVTSFMCDDVLATNDSKLALLGSAGAFVGPDLSKRSRPSCAYVQDAHIWGSVYRQVEQTRHQTNI